MIKELPRLRDLGNLSEFGRIIPHILQDEADLEEVDQIDMVEEAIEGLAIIRFNLIFRQRIRGALVYGFTRERNEHGLPAIHMFVVQNTEGVIMGFYSRHSRQTVIQNGPFIKRTARELIHEAAEAIEWNIQAMK